MTIAQMVFIFSILTRISLSKKRRKEPRHLDEKELENEGENKVEAADEVEQVNNSKKEDMQKNLDQFLLEQEMMDMQEKEAHMNRPVTTCNSELIHSYRLFPRKDISDNQTNFLCPFISSTNDCCELNSQNMIQILWGRISKPRLERELTYHLASIETILNDMKDVMGLFKNGELPGHTEYSAECLDAVNKMDQLEEDNFFEITEEMYVLIKIGFERLFKFMKQFYCGICDRRNHEYINVFDKQIIVSDKFCLSLSTDFKDMVYFLNYQLIKQFQTIRNFVLCYRKKNYLLVKDMFKFKFDKTEAKKINDCIFNNDCISFCGEFSPSMLKEFFIGKKEWLDEMRKFLEQNKVDNRGFLEDATADDDINKDAEKEHEMEEEIKKMEFFKPENRTVDEVQWDFWREMFDISKKKMTQKKMASIKRKMKREFEDDMLHQIFINTNKAKIKLDVYKIKNQNYGINYYDYLDKEELYKTNAQLSFYMKPLDNTVGELLNMDETSILEHMITVSKYIKDNQQPEDMVKYIESKIFKNEENQVHHLIQDPYIKKMASARLVEILVVGLVAIGLF